MKYLIAAITGASLLGSGLAQADGRTEAGDCPHPPKVTKPPRRPAPPKRPIDSPKPCTCKGERGDTGPQGPKGNDGMIDVKIIHDINFIEVQAEPAIKVDLGLMGFNSSPYGDWAWGPAIGLSTRVSEHYDLTFNAGLAAGASDGRESGYMLELLGTRRLRQDLGAFGGVYRVRIDGGPDNGNIDGDYLGLTAGITLSGHRTRFSIGPTLTGLRDDSRDGSRLAVGVQGSLFVRVGK